MFDPGQLHEKVCGAVCTVAGGDIWHRLLKQFSNLSLFLAGGALRDLLLERGRPPKDFDIFIGGSDCEAALAQIAKEGVMSYGPFGSPRWFPDAASDSYWDIIPIARFYNGLWQCADIIDVLNQFDFTANALALDLQTGEFYDPQNGRRDLSRKIMRAVRFDYPQEPIVHGQLLTRPEIVWFRLIHYTAALGFEIEPVTARWIFVHREWAKSSANFEKLFFRLEPSAKAMLEMVGSKYGF